MSVPRQGGFTIVELMITVIIAAIAISAALTMGFTITASYREHRRMVMVERSARVSLEIISNAVRAASPGVPSGNLGDLVGCSTFGGMRVTNGGANAPDSIDVVTGSGGVVTSIRQPYLDSSTQLLLTDGTALRPGDYVVVTNLDVGHVVKLQNVVPAGAEWSGTVNAAVGSCPTVTFPPGGYPAGSLVIRARVARFFVDASEPALPILMMDPDGDGPDAPEPLADGIEDMQIAVGVDSNNDGTVFEDRTTTDEWFFNAPGDAVPPPTAVTPARALRITLVARALFAPDSLALFTRPAAEDRAAGSAADPFRRRVLTSTVEIRNIEGSP